MRSLTIRGAAPADVQIIDGRITAIGSVKDDIGEVIDARGLTVLPGVIDPQVHFREPGLTHKEDLASGSRAAAAGGVTTFLEMPNTKPPTTTGEALAWKLQRAAETSVVDFGFFIGATRDNLEVLNRVSPAAGIKIFMGSSTGDLLVSERADLEQIFAGGTRLIAVHAEDEARLRERIAAASGTTDPARHSDIRDATAALIASTLALDLSEKYDRRLHILHLSTGDEVALLRRRGKGAGRVTAECTPQHLLLNAPEVYERLGTKAQMNPPLRTREHSDALWAGLRDGTIDCIATDHAPHTLEEKNAGYPKSPSGMPGVETSLAVMLDAASRGLCSLAEVVRWMCEAPARCYRIEKKGRLELGDDGDLVLVDLAARRRVGDRPYFTKVGWNPFEGMWLRGWPVITVVRGAIVYRDGAIDETHRGAAVRFMGSPQAAA